MVTTGHRTPRGRDWPFTPRIRHVGGGVVGVAAVVREVAGGIATARRNREDLNQDKMYLNMNKDSKRISKISIIKSAVKVVQRSPYYPWN